MSTMCSAPLVSFTFTVIPVGVLRTTWGFTSVTVKATRGRLPYLGSLGLGLALYCAREPSKGSPTARSTNPMNSV